MSQPRTVEVEAILALSRSTSPVGETVEQFIEGDAAFDAREGVADADVGAVAEGEMRAARPVDVEFVRALELAFVAVGGAAVLVAADGGRPPGE